jgi:hypothetical protein
MFNFLKTAPAATGPSASNLKAKRNYNLAHSKSRVANVLSKPGQVTYTNKVRIQKEYEQAIAELRKIERPVETASAVGSIAEKLRQAINSPEAKETGAVVITIPVGLAQLAYKALMVFVAALVLVFWDIPTMGTIPLSAYIAPNRGFNTTRNAYAEARRFTGANSGLGTVKNF